MAARGGAGRNEETGKKEGSGWRGVGRGKSIKNDEKEANEDGRELRG